MKYGRLTDADVADALITWTAFWRHHCHKYDWIGLFNVPPNTLLVIWGADFYGSNDLTISVKTLKEDRF